MSTQLAEHAEMLLPYDAPRPVWLEARRTGIGGSDALACLGLDPWKTRLEAYLDKIGQAPGGTPAPLLSSASRQRSER